MSIMHFQFAKYLLEQNFHSHHYITTSVCTWFQQVGPKKAREMWFLARFYTAFEAEKMGLVNIVVPVSLSMV